MSGAFGGYFNSTVTSSTSPHPAYFAEIDRNRAVSLMVWKARQQHPFDAPLDLARRRATFEWTPPAFGIDDRSLSDFNRVLEQAAIDPNAEAFVETARLQGVSLSELIAEQYAPESLARLRIWYELAGAAVRFEIRHGFSDGPRLRHLTTVLADPNDIRGIGFETFGNIWRESRRAVVLFTDVAPTRMDEFQHALPLNSLEAFLAQRAARTLTTPVWVKVPRTKLRLFRMPGILWEESGEEFFRRVARMIREAGAVKVNIEETTFSLN